MESVSKGGGAGPEQRREGGRRELEGAGCRSWQVVEGGGGGRRRGAAAAVVRGLEQ